jgi:hypothetical protein
MALQNLINLFSASSPLARFALLLTDSLLLIPYMLALSTSLARDF